MHTSMCEACRSYQKQSKDMDSLLNDHIHSNTDTPDSNHEALSGDFKDQIIKKLEKK